MPQPRLSRLQERLIQHIKLNGPISITDYWAQALFDPQEGYYSSREPFGTDGDFTTAPEISQMFGEMLGVWWLETIIQNNLSNCALVEIGPGRGTLMADMLRTIEKLKPSLAQSLPVHMVETSERLSLIQKEKLKSTNFSITWHKSIDTLPPTPLGIIANELFDAIPIRQFIQTPTGWHELCVGLNDDSDLCFVAGITKPHPELLPETQANQPLGTIFEYAPARQALMEKIVYHLSAHAGFGLFIDYGHAKSGFGDTLQALKNHNFINALQDPGLADITSHVDFASLSYVAQNHRLTTYQIIEQGPFLFSLGIKNRLENLISANTNQRNTLVTACERLTENDQMGRLFKVLGISHPSISLPVLQKSS